MSAKVAANGIRTHARQGRRRKIFQGSQWKKDQKLAKNSTI